MNKKILSLLICAMSTLAGAQEIPNLNKNPLDSGASEYRPSENQDININDFLSSTLISGESKKENEIPAIRSEMIKELALTTGTQAGLLRAARESNKILETQALTLDRIFDFNAMMIDNNVIAPVLTEGRATFTQNSEDEIRISDRMFKIESPAHFVPHPPTWRDYLIQNTTSLKIDMPMRTLLPKTDAEKSAWDNWAKQGWNNGINQSKSMFTQNLARLKRDYVGMIQYKILRAQGLVSSPIVAATNLGTTGGGSEMALKDKTFRIMVPSNLIANPNSWKNYPIE